MIFIYFAPERTIADANLQVLRHVYAACVTTVVNYLRGSSYISVPRYISSPRDIDHLVLIT